MYTVYEHKNKINNKRYIGVTSKKVEERWSKKAGSYSANKRFQNAILKYGWDGFEHNVLFKHTDKSVAYNKEVDFIALYDTTNFEKGYNRHIGGNAGFKGLKHTEETKKKISESVKEALQDETIRVKISKGVLTAYAKDPSYRKRVARKADSRDVNYFKHTEETKKKISKTLQETFRHSEESKQKISVSMKGRKHKKPYSEETIRKFSEKRKEYWKNKNARVALIE